MPMERNAAVIQLFEELRAKPPPARNVKKRHIAAVPNKTPTTITITKCVIVLDGNADSASISQAIAQLMSPQESGSG